MATKIPLRRVALTLAIATASLITNVAHAADKVVKRPKGSKTESTAKDLEFAPVLDVEPLEAEAPKVKTSSFGVGIGLFSVFLPQTAVQAAYIYKNKFVAGLQLGYLLIPSKEFTARSVYFGVDAKYFPMPKSNFFIGLAAGQRKVEVVTRSTVTVNEEVTEVFWLRTAKQAVLTPRIGWQPLNTGTVASVISLGLTVPFGTSFSVESEPTTIPKLTAKEYEDEKTNKGNDVKTFTNKPMPHIELGFFWYLGGGRKK